MNERIKLFEKQCWDYQSNCLDAEKFAEFLVKECVSVVEKRFMGDLNREDMEVRRCVADLKEHFGVE